MPRVVGPRNDGREGTAPQDGGTVTASSLGQGTYNSVERIGSGGHGKSIHGDSRVVLF